jgi:4-amino-4-deoxy-L-arabinose transferase-like glycosyltransferase
MSVSRPWLALVIALFCLPLFIGLGRRDLANDEAIYSFAVDRILESGDWLEPKLSPDDDLPFIEKPPLKFWMVAAPIRAGLLPHSEFGLRFWDALSGGLAFVYVFLLGSRLIGPLAGAVAVLTLFGHFPLLYDHGLRDNAMEAPLLLSYCGGMYHVLAWSADESRRRRAHAFAAGLYFVLGFMVKFVAALFLPVVLLTALMAMPAARARLVRDWRLWLGVAAVVLLLVAPWFLYAYARYGQLFWTTILGVHVYQRFTAALDAAHVQPWYYYFLTLYDWLSASGVAVLAAGGFLVLAWQVFVRKRLDALVIILWAFMPIVLLSFGSSKLYHYVYPFLPAHALAAGYFVAILLGLAAAPIGRAAGALRAYVRQRVPSLSGAGGRWSVRIVFAALVVALAVFALVNLARGRTSNFRPAIVALPFALPLAFGPRGRQYVLPFVVFSLLPLPAYRASLVALTEESHPYRSTAECLADVDGTLGSTRGLYVPWPYLGTSHPVNYYFRRVKPWERDLAVNPSKVATYGLGRSADVRPILIYGSEYRKLPADLREGLPKPVDLKLDGLLILPGPYARCAMPDLKVGLTY